MDLEERIAAALAGHKTETKRMFGGLCFMLNGNMLTGTFRNGMMVRISKQHHADALNKPGASAMEMKGRVMEGFILITADAVNTESALRGWIDMALAYNKTLPAKETKAKSASKKKKK